MVLKKIDFKNSCLKFNFNSDNNILNEVSKVILLFNSVYFNKSKKKKNNFFLCLSLFKIKYNDIILEKNSLKFSYFYKCNYIVIYKE